MINKTHGTDPQPFAGLTPEVVLDAAAAFGLAPDGRLFALNSYENRVYQLGAGDTQLVLKFYRPQRWSDAQIAEEHQFTAELATAERRCSRARCCRRRCASGIPRSAAHCSSA